MNLYPRTILNDIYDSLQYKEFIVIVGSRQCGKTSVLRLIENYLKEGKHQTLYLSLEDPEVLSKLNSHPEELFSFIPKTENFKYILIDEVQYLKDPTNFLKYHFDFHHKQLKIISTGSSAFYIDRKFKDSLAGRKKIFNLYTLCFKEFLHFKTGNDDLNSELKEIISRDNYYSLKIRTLYQYLDEYLTYGGYPAVVLLNDLERKKSLLNELSRSFIKRDILESGIRNEEKFFFLLKILASQTGGLLNMNQLANSLQLSVTSIENYITILRKTFHIHLVRPFFRNLKKELTKMPKAYFNDLGLRNTLLNQFMPIENRLDKGGLIENFVFIELRNKYDPEEIRYWRTINGNEVDFIVTTEFDKGFALECKFDEKMYNPKKYAKFTSEYPNYPLEVKSYKSLGNKTSLFSI
ncbi:MAG: ATP-binding protein [Chlorobi bacterium]|nr:ATP-binding protein [Chlorobiota bacterium]